MINDMTSVSNVSIMGSKTFLQLHVSVKDQLQILIFFVLE